MKDLLKSKFFLPGFLVLISLIVYKVWLSFSIFVYGDGVFFFKDALKDFVIPSEWGGLGGPLIWHYPFSLIYGIFGLLGLGSNVAEKFLIFWPIIILAPIVSYFFVKKITGSSIAGFIGSLVFAYNTYFLSIDTQSHELLTVAFILGTIAFLSFIYLLETKKRYLIPLTALLLFVVGFVDLRSLYVLVGVIFLYSIFNQVFLENSWKTNLKTNVINFLSIFIILFLLNLYWIIPLFSTNTLTNNEYLNRGIFGSQFYDLQSSLTSFYPYWTGKEPTWLYVQKIPMYFWLYPLLAFAGLIAMRKNKKLYFFALLALLGVFLAKQEGEPFGFVYAFLFAHIPGFSAFREASKFDYLTHISYAVLIGALADFLWTYFKNKKVKYLALFLLALFFLWNTKPLITGEIKTMFVPINLSTDFVKLKNYTLANKEYSRIVGISQNQKYIFSTYLHPEQDLLSSIAHFWGTDILSYQSNVQTNMQAEDLMDYLKTPEAQRLLMNSSVEYIPVFIKDDPTYQSIRRDLGKERYYFESQMDKIKYLKKVDLGMKNILLYKTLDYKPHIYLTTEKESLKKDVSYQKVDFKMITPSEYHILFKNLSKPVYLNFTELDDLSWKIHVGRFNWWEVLLNENYFPSENIHSQNVVRFNEFIIDPKEICKIAICHINKNGSYTFEATLYAKQQSYLYLGLILSGVALVFIVGSTIYLWRRYEK